MVLTRFTPLSVRARRAIVSIPDDQPFGPQPYIKITSVAAWVGVTHSNGTNKASARLSDMIDMLIGLLIALVVVGLIYWAVTAILSVVPLPEPIRTVINVVLIVILVLIVIYALLPLLHAIPTHLGR